jgi:hypothetical protein
MLTACTKAPEAGPRSTACVDVGAIRSVVDRYIASIEAADPELARRVWAERDDMLPVKKVNETGSAVAAVVGQAISSLERGRPGKDPYCEPAHELDRLRALSDPVEAV